MLGIVREDGRVSQDLFTLGNKITAVFALPKMSWEPNQHLEKGTEEYTPEASSPCPTHSSPGNNGDNCNHQHPDAYRELSTFHTLTQASGQENLNTPPIPSSHRERDLTSSWAPTFSLLPSLCPVF